MERCYERPHDLAFHAHVVDQYECNGATNLILDHTLFFPSIPQSPHPKDRGFINGIRVYDVIRQDGQIVHMLAQRANFKIGECVSGVIDQTIRAPYLAHHTVEHLILRVLERDWGITPLAWKYEHGVGRIIVTGSKLNRSILYDVTAEVNALTRANLPIYSYHEYLHREPWIRLPIRNDYEYLQRKPSLRLPIRNTPKLGEKVRIVEIGKFEDVVDRAVCDGLHCESTGMIAQIAVPTFKASKRKVNRWQISYEARLYH
jgi:Ser-tRNA(Ala) deacylase AlaX